MPDIRFTADPTVSKRSQIKGSTPTDVVASTVPEDSLSDYVVPADSDPLTPPPSLEDQLPDSVSPITTADTELVHQLEAELARARARLAGQDSDVRSWPVSSVPVPKDGEKIVIHIRKDGFTAAGQVWYLGQELEFVVGSPVWKDTCDLNGNSWVLLSDVDQIRRYGEVQFGFGPWPGEPFTDEKAALAERRRARSVRPISQLASLNTKL